MASFEQRIQEQNRPTDGGGLGILDAFDEGLVSGLKELQKVQCDMLGSKPADEHLSKCEHHKDDSGEYLVFNPTPGAKQEFASGVDNFDQWLDGKTALKKAGAA